MDDDDNTDDNVRQQMISFRADDEILRALVIIEAAVDSNVISRRKRSVAIRQAILDAARRALRRPSPSSSTNSEEQ